MNLMNSLTLNKATRKIGKNQTSREYFDFFVSGKSFQWSVYPEFPPIQPFLVIF